MSTPMLRPATSLRRRRADLLFAAGDGLQHMPDAVALDLGEAPRSDEPGLNVLHPIAHRQRRRSVIAGAAFFGGGVAHPTAAMGALSIAEARGEREEERHAAAGRRAAVKAEALPCA